MLTLDQGERYAVASDPIGGILVTRLRDGADLYFQPGDDAIRARLQFDRLGENADAMGEMYSDGLQERSPEASREFVARLRASGVPA